MWLLNIIIVTFLWASVLLISEVLRLPSPVFVFFRLVFSLFIVLPLAIKAGLKKPDFRSFTSGFLLALNWIFLFMAVKRIGASTADLLYYTAPVISLILERFLGNPIPVWSWISAIVSFSGVAMIYSFSSSEIAGMSFALIAGFFYGSVVVLGKHTSIRVHPFVFTFYQMISASLLTLFFAFPYFKPLTSKELILLAIAGILNTGIALLLWWATLKTVNLRIASVLTYLDPVFAMILSTLFLNFKPSVWNIIGGTLIISGGAFAVWKEMSASESGDNGKAGKRKNNNGY